MAAEAAGLRPATRALLLALAAACGLLAAWAGRADTLPAPTWLAGWTAAHPDPRAFSPDEMATLARAIDEQRRDDLVLLLAGLAVGCLAVAAQPPLARAAGGVLAGVLAMLVGPSSTWLQAGLTERVWRLGLVMAAGGVAYFGALWLLGFRPKDFSRRDRGTAPDPAPAVEPDDA